ncbi:hypothetical protein [Aquitalea pelogenes]|uniref:hypothetical protein n=1 Tax=Aquitalea pelogenes TaxID=1293573 RepID=UPI0035B191D0
MKNQESTFENVLTLAASNQEKDTPYIPEQREMLLNGIIAAKREKEKESEIKTQATIKERIKYFNHEHGCLSYLSVHFENDGTMIIFFNQVKGCTKVYEGKAKYFNESDLKVLLQYGFSKLFYNTDMKPYKTNGLEEEYLQVINK